MANPEWYDPQASQLRGAPSGQPMYGSATSKNPWDQARFQEGLRPWKQGMGSAEQGYAQAMAAQGQALNMYGQAAQGQGPSVAVQLSNQAGQAAQRAGFEAGLRGSGGNLTGMASQTQAGMAAANQQATAQAGALRAQEIEAARAGYAGVAGGMAGQSGQMAQFYGGQMQNAQLAQMQSDLQYGMFNREMALKEKQAKHQRRQDWLNFGGKVAGSVFGGVAGAGAGGAG